jgi:hypothetical protein
MPERWTSFDSAVFAVAFQNFFGNWMRALLEQDTGNAKSNADR